LYEKIPKPKTCCQNSFLCLKNSVKNWTKNVKTRKIANILETAENIVKSSKFQSFATPLGVLQRMIILNHIESMMKYDIICHKCQKPQAPTPHAPIRNLQTRKVANAKVRNRNTNLI